MQDITHAPHGKKRSWMYLLLSMALGLAFMSNAVRVQAAGTDPVELNFKASASDQTVGTIVLQWSGKNVHHYSVYKHNPASHQFEKLFDTPAAGTYLDQGLTVNQGYNYRVEAYRSETELAQTIGWNLNVRHLFVTADNANQAFHLNWTSSGEGIVYDLHVMKDYGTYYGDILPIQYGLTGLSAVITGLNLDEDYVFMVDARNPVTGQYIVNSQSNFAKSALYSQPFNLYATEDNMTVHLNWDTLPGNKEYVVNRATASGGPYTIISPPQLTGTSFNDYTARYGTAYYYMVTAISTTGVARNSNEIVARPHPENNLSVLYKAADTQDNTMLPHLIIRNFRNVPADLSKMTVRYWYSQDTATQDRVWCDWAQVGCANAPATIKASASPSPTANKYIELAFTPSAGTIPPGGTSGEVRLRLDNTTFTNYDKLNDYSYTGQTVFADSPTITLYENGKLVWGVEPTSDLPAPPQNVKAFAGNGQVMLSWDRPIGTTRYAVKRSTSPLGPFTPVTPYDWTLTNFTDAAAQNGTTYYYVVTASNNSGESPPSQVVSAMPKPGQSNVTQSLASVSAQYRAGDNHATNNTINPYISLKNTGNSPVALSELKVRYYFTVDGDTPQNFVCDWAQVGCANVQGKLVKLSTAKPGADYFLEFSFDAAAGMLAPGSSSGDIQSRIHKANWANYNETGDYSYAGNRPTLTDTDKITVYQNDALIWGIEP